MEDDDDLDEPRDLTEGLVRENALGEEADAWRAGGAKNGAGSAVAGGNGRAGDQGGLVDV